MFSQILSSWLARITSLRALHVISLLLLALLSIPIFYSFKNGYGDSLFLEDFARDIFVDGGNWRSWSMTPSASWIPDVLLYCLGFHIFSNPFDTMYFVSLCQILLIYLCTTRLVRFTTHGSNEISTLLLIHILMIVVYCSYTTAMWMFFSSTNNHISPFIMILFSIAALLYEISAPRIVNNLLHSALAIAGILSGPIYMIGFVYPLPIVVVLCSVLSIAAPQLRSTCRRLVLPCAVIAITFVLYDCIIGLPAQHFVPQLNLMTNSFSLLARDTWDLIAGRNPLFYLLIALWCVGIICCIYQLGATLTCKESALVRSNPLLFLSVFALVSVPLELAAVVVSGGVHNHGGYRYLMLPIALPLIILCVTANAASSRPRVRRITRGVFFVVEIAILAFVLTNLPSHFTRHRSAYITPSESEKFRDAFDFPISREQVIDHYRIADKMLVDCLDAQVDRYDLHTGVAEFWDSRSISLLSKKGLRAYAFTSTLEPLYMMTSIDRYIGTSGAKAPRYNFVVTSERFPPGHNRHLSARTIRTMLGTETASFVCHDAPEKNLVLVYDDRADQFIKHRIEPMVARYHFMRGDSPTLSLRGSDLQYSLGKRLPASIATIANTQGLVTYGPYLQLSPGSYFFELTISSLGAPTHHTVGNWDIFTALDQRIHQSGPLIFNGHHQSLISGTFTVSRKTRHLFWELRTFSSGLGQFEVVSMTITRQ